MSSDDEITKKIFLHAPNEEEIPTRKIPAPAKCSTHEGIVACRCPCHSRPTIHHLRPCCTPCTVCGFRVLNPKPPPEEDSSSSEFEE